MSKKMFLLVACVSLMLFVNTTLDAAPAKDKIRIGCCLLYTSDAADE